MRKGQASAAGQDRGWWLAVRAMLSSPHLLIETSERQREEVRTIMAEDGVPAQGHRRRGRLLERARG